MLMLFSLLSDFIAADAAMSRLPLLMMLAITMPEYDARDARFRRFYDYFF